MKFRVESEVVVNSLGTIRHSEVMDFPDDSNVFGRVLQYHETMRKRFPFMDGFKLIEAKEIRDGE